MTATLGMECSLRMECEVVATYTSLPKYTSRKLHEMATPVILEPTNARSRRTCSRLLATARAILERDGFQALTIAAVAEQASVTRRTVYLHFGSRGELVAALFD